MTTSDEPHPDDLPGTWRAIGCLLRLVAPERYREAFLGDLIEEHVDTAALLRLIEDGVPSGLPFVPPGAP